MEEFNSERFALVYKALCEEFREEAYPATSVIVHFPEGLRHLKPMFDQMNMMVVKIDTIDTVEIEIDFRYKGGRLNYTPYKAEYIPGVPV